MIDSKLQELARFGAEARLRSLEEERRAILGMFPELRNSAASAGRVRNSVAEPWSGSPTPRRKRMSPAMRKTVGNRMRAYWASKRAERQHASEAPSAERRRPKGVRQASKLTKAVSSGH
jgi:hypothetical protein